MVQRRLLCANFTLNHQKWPLNSNITIGAVSTTLQKMGFSIFSSPYQVAHYSSPSRTSSSQNSDDNDVVELLRSQFDHWKNAFKNSCENIEEVLLKPFRRFPLGRCNGDYDNILCLNMNICCENRVQEVSPSVGTLWTHASNLLNPVDQNVDQSVHAEGGGVEGEEDVQTVKKKRKKLKGKRAVVRFLKFLRWKKKRDYARMTEEEKILFKLTKARKKEERIVEALSKIVPKESSNTAHDPEILTPEEHFYFLKMGIKSKNYVPVGRRGIYQGVILNMHLHWKKHQTLKVIVKTFTPDEVKEVASELARLSGGIVLDIQDEDTVIMYRGKNYSQPPTEIMSPRSTLSRKKALDKSKYRDGLRAVRKFIPRLEQDLDLMRSRNLSKPGFNPNDGNQEEVIQTNPEDVRRIMCDLDSDSEEGLSDMFEMESEAVKNEGKYDRPLYMDELDKFWVDDKDCEEETEDLEHGKSSKEEKIEDLPGLDQMFLQAASLLKKKKAHANKR
ncbi:uncharacterized CRM domain-containing protein At3g25440, chloroplastic [Impatiens glandulifera]|uniref:uncharacterized CRM domain-containing protein At3g25440, chloroplastic n=1 Tax=Impatiens glandulifera TaxID=253017 RepID=UPI001FB08B4F|nr:uncharacterized CRM domain-containing protein At3g25440, chloroplastic [Impatiens glandulifera]